GAGVHPLALDEDLGVEMRARRTPRVAGEPEDPAALDPVALLDGGLREVAVHAADVVVVLDDDEDAVLRLRAREGDRAGGRGADRRPLVGVDVEAVVKLGDLCPRRQAVAELGVHAAAHGPARRQRRKRLARARHQAVEGAEVITLLHDAFRETLDLVFRARRGGRAIGLPRAAADAPVAPARRELGAERLPDARVELAPAHHLLAEVGDAAVERVDGRTLI